MDASACAAIRQSLLSQLAHQTSPADSSAARFILQTVVPTATPDDALSAALPLLNHLLDVAALRPLPTEQILLASSLISLVTPAAMAASKAHKGVSPAESLLVAVQLAQQAPEAAAIRRSAIKQVTPLLFEVLTRHQRSELFLVSCFCTIKRCANRHAYRLIH